VIERAVLEGVLPDIAAVLRGERVELG